MLNFNHCFQGDQGLFRDDLVLPLHRLVLLTGSSLPNISSSDYPCEGKESPPVTGSP